MMDDRFLNSEVAAEEPSGQGQDFVALGHSGSDAYVGLETFKNPGCFNVTYSSDEVMAVCPITGQPDFYTVGIQLQDADKCIESKSLKLWFQNLMKTSLGPEGHGIFCEALAVHIRDRVAEVVECDTSQVAVKLTQKSRGGISITAMA
jgi:7-cyano-7-deazaguanine reductase